MHTKGRAFLLKIGDDSTPPKYSTVAGLRVSNESIVPGAYTTQAFGIFLGSTAEAAIRTHALAGTIADYELSFEDGERLQGRFLVQRLDYAGDFNGERNYTLQLSQVTDTLAGLNPDAVADVVAALEASQAILKLLLPNWSSETKAQIAANGTALARIRGEG